MSATCAITTSPPQRLPLTKEPPPLLSSWYRVRVACMSRRKNMCMAWHAYVVNAVLYLSSTRYRQDLGVRDNFSHVIIMVCSQTFSAWQNLWQAAFRWEPSAWVSV